MVSKQFFEALDELEKTKGIAKEDFMASFKTALEIAYKKYAGDSARVEIKADYDKKSLKFYSIRTIVEIVEDPDNEICIEDALEERADAKVGEELVIEFTPNDFTRIAAQTTKQVITQKLREIERNNTVSEFEDKEGELMASVIRRVEGGNVYVEIGANQIEGVLLPKDQVPGEKYEVNQKLDVFVKRVKNMGKNAQVLVSRTSSGLVRRLFENEVPEIKDGMVEIKGIEREPGQRTKIAIYATDPDVDAIGACIGNKGSRVNAIVAELNGEKIDIIPWSENPLEFIAKSLSPAKVIKVDYIAEKSARAVVPDDKLSLAIGRNGQNARLAARLTGWKIDVKSESVALSEGDDFIPQTEEENI